MSWRKFYRISADRHLGGQRKGKCELVGDFVIGIAIRNHFSGFIFQAFGYVERSLPIGYFCCIFQIGFQQMNMASPKEKKR